MGNQYIDVRKEYVERVKRELLGPGSEVCIPDAEHELISSSPSIRYSIGIWVSLKSSVLQKIMMMRRMRNLRPRERSSGLLPRMIQNNPKRKTPTAQKPVPTQKRIRLMSKSGWLCRTCRLPWDIRFLPKAAVIHSLSI